jgi:hypothetical protein
MDAVQLWVTTATLRFTAVIQEESYWVFASGLGSWSWLGLCLRNALTCLLQRHPRSSYRYDPCTSRYNNDVSKES